MPLKELQHERHERMTPEQRAAEHEADEKAKAAEEAAKKQEELWQRRHGQDPRKFNQPQRFLGGGDDITANMPELSNIEDRRGEFDDRAKYMKENTAELKRLNDFLFGGAAAGGSGGPGGGAGGGGGFASRLGLGPGGIGGINTGAASVAGAAGAGAGGAGAGAGAGAAAAGLGDPAAPRNQRGAALYQKLLTEFQKNPPQGLPPDAARLPGSRRARRKNGRGSVFQLPHAELGFNPQSANTSDPGGSFGVFQYAHNQVPGGNAYDVDSSVQAFVRDANKSASDRRFLRGGILGQRFSTIGKHPERGAAYLRQASELRAGGAQSPAGQVMPGAVTAVGGADPKAFIFHHTSGRGTIAGLKDTLNERHLGVEYAMDRDGNIVQIGGPGSSHMKTGWGPLGTGLSNRNTSAWKSSRKTTRM